MVGGLRCTSARNGSCSSSVDLFYFKTCSFRGACARRRIDPVTQREDVEGIFCIDTPVARYGMTRCGRPAHLCGCCRMQNARANGGGETPALVTGVTFTSSYRHQFVNHYQAILNCPVVSISPIHSTVADVHFHFAYLRLAQHRTSSTLCRVLVENSTTSARPPSRSAIDYYVSDRRRAPSRQRRTDQPIDT
jgi:hypothetical protein